MALLLGIDTGGTFTDAVIVDDELAAGIGGGQIIAHAKAPTTHHDLAVGIAGSVDRALTAVGPHAAARIALVSISTTLATNALVEGHGEPAALFTFGFSRHELRGVHAAVPADLIVAFEGGHDAHGNERTPLALAEIEAAAKALSDRVSAYAVAAQFSVRNPGHEREAARVIREATSKPVTASHELSAKLDGPRRALTAALNARLLGTIDRLNRSVGSVLAGRAINAPIMVVRGDGSLVSAAFAGERPIETILSGPAASVVGAMSLAGIDSGLVADIGGTTTDVAVISDGRPKIASSGAIVGGHRTMVEAVEMETVGLGGDSEVWIDTRSPAGPIQLGPARAIPICQLALTHPGVHAVLDRQLGEPMGLVDHGRFLVSISPADVQLSDEREAAVLARLTDGPVPVGDVARNGLQMRAAGRLRARGLVRIASMTPTDAAAILGSLHEVDATAAEKVAAIMARQSGRDGSPIASGPAEIARRVSDELVRRSAQFVVKVALDADGLAIEPSDPLLAASLRDHRGTATVSVRLSDPIVAIGAPAANYYHRVAALAGTVAAVPDHAAVANAFGAVVGQVRIAASATITQPTRGQYRVHLDDQPTFGSVDNARRRATELLERNVLDRCEAAGASSPELSTEWSARTAHMDGKEVFVEGTVTVVASGRPRF